jgi:hypothetical protein
MRERKRPEEARRKGVIWDVPFRWMDRNHISRRLALFVTLWITVDSYAWAKHFAESARQTDSLQVPAIIAAVLAAVTGLQGWVFKLYLDGKAGE